MNREAFLSQVRRATGSPTLAGRPDFLVPSPVRARTALMAEMAQRWQRPHAAWYYVTTEEVARTVIGVLTAANLKHVILSGHPLVAELNLASALEDAGIVLLPLPHSDGAVRAGVAGADAGVTVVRYGVAETGTLLEVADPAQPRTLSLLPPVHIAILPAEAILPTLDDLFAALAAGPPKHTMVFISGPSGTADIGLQHVVGVHGPGDVHLVVVDEQRG